MEGFADELLKSAAAQFQGSLRRRFLGEVCLGLCDGNARRTEARFGWGRETISKELEGRLLDRVDAEAIKSNNRGRQRSEDANPQLKLDIELIVEPHTHTDPELKTDRRYTNLSAKEVRRALFDRGYSKKEVPSERTMRDILNRMNYRLKPTPSGDEAKG